MERVTSLFQENYGAPMEMLQPEAAIESLGLDSLDKIEFLLALEKEFKIKISDREAVFRSIQDIICEWATVIVLKSWDHAMTRGARIYGEAIGNGSMAEGEYITRPPVNGQSFAMQAAMDEAGMGQEHIDYINAHGTGTLANDSTETDAIKNVFGQRAYKIPISSTKSMHGHLLGAAGAVELVATILASRNRTIPPTATLTVPDPQCDLAYVPQKARTGVKLKTVMSNSFAFGGTSAVLIVRRHD